MNWSRPPVRGIVVNRPSRPRDALEHAHRAANHHSTWGDIELNIFSDASRHSNDDTGGIAIIFKPWMPHESMDDSLIKRAYPVDPLYDPNLGELLAIAEALATAIQEISDNSDSLGGERVKMTIFSDSRDGLKALDG